MIKNRKLAKSISNVGMREFRRQLEYKAEWRGRQIVTVNRYFPSTKTCSRCGTVKNELKLSERIFKCSCGLEINRDLNAAINLKNTARSTEVKAFGDGSSDMFASECMKLSSMN